ncbi:MFS general substrate transporter [Basidiobolus meristosporus CBS 931.73]|uniref:MFS general substrate transporter n=1 Tax=Basidiobolus meristosporus CBS 931.73 TaxID=1314790 RepID=A0A1Y1Y7E2_9FUNG|nr:MFS general substrate transporter [Basidiobolus meristosporus CBS 931.73]|eukprot:ORX93923.1 MFS general substrate transporter [Basidiobolus meristosporus CBS 931.73]
MAIFTDMLIYGIVIPILPTIVEEKIQGDSTTIGLLMGFFAAGLLVATPFFALLSDRYRKRKIPMLLSLLSLCVACALFPLANKFWEFLLIRIIQGVSGAASWVIGIAMLADTFPPHQFGIAVGTAMSGHGVGFAIGPTIGGLLFEHSSYASPFILCAAIAFLDFLIRLILAPSDARMKEMSDAIEEETRNMQENAKKTKVDTEAGNEIELEKEVGIEKKPLNMITMLKHWSIVKCCLITLISTAAYACVEPTLTIYLGTEFKYSTGAIGLIYIALVVPNVFIAPVSGWLSDRYGRMFVCGIGVTIFALVITFLAVPKDIWGVILVMIFCGGAQSMALTPVQPELGDCIRSLGGGAYAQAFGLFNMAFSGGMFIGPIVGGVAYDKIGFMYTLLIFALANAALIPFVVAKPQRQF